jgi:hypothetical protein
MSNDRFAYVPATREQHVAAATTMLLNYADGMEYTGDPTYAAAFVAKMVAEAYQRGLRDGR